MRQSALIILGLVTVFHLSAGICSAEEGHGNGNVSHGSGHDGEEQRVAKDARGIWKEINSRVAKLEDIIKDGKLDKVHVAAFEIRDLANELPKVSADIVPDKKQKQLNGYIKRIGQHAKNLDKFGDAGNAAKTKEEFEQFVKRLKYLAALYPDVFHSSGTH